MNRRVIGVQIGATTRPTELHSVIAEAERLGFGEVWLAEDYFDLGGIASAAIALAATDEIPIGLGVVAAPARHPAVAAMEFATLGVAYPGRLMAGIGHGAPGWVRQMGLQPASPMGLLREATEAIRRLLDGGELSHHGDYFSFDHVRLSQAPADPIPIVMGVQGPASLRLSGELANGTLLGWFSSPSYVAWARDRIDEGRARAGRTDVHELVALCVLSLSDVDPDAAHGDVGEWATRNLAAMTEMPQLKISPARKDLLVAIERVQHDRSDPHVAPGTTTSSTLRHPHAHDAYMNDLGVRSAVEVLLGTELSVADHDQLADAATALARVQSFLDHAKVQISRRGGELAEAGDTSSNHVLIDEGRCTGSDARATDGRGRVCETMPGFEEALAAGDVTGAHLDSLAQHTRA